MLRNGNLDISVILPFGDHEDVIGTAIQRLVAHLDERKLSFEILAIDRDSGDNSHAVLALVRSGNSRLASTLEITAPPTRSRHRGYEYGALRAHGRVLWLLDPHAAMEDLLGFDRAYGLVADGTRDLVIHADRFALAHRTRCAPAFAGLEASGRRFHARLLRRARLYGLAVEPEALGPRQQSRGLRRFLAALSHGFTY